MYFELERIETSLHEDPSENQPLAAGLKTRSLHAPSSPLPLGGPFTSSLDSLSP